MTKMVFCFLKNAWQDYGPKNYQNINECVPQPNASQPSLPQTNPPYPISQTSPVPVNQPIGIYGFNYQQDSVGNHLALVGSIRSRRGRGRGH